MSSNVSSVLVELDHALARVILVTVVESTPLLGRPPARGFVAAALSGSLRDDLTKADAHRLPTFGVLAFHRRDAIVAAIDRLIDLGALESVKQPRAGIVLSSEGRAFLEKAATARTGPLGLVSGAVDPGRLDRAVRSGLVDALRRYRSRCAVAEEVPEWRVFDEATLRELAAALPSTREQLECVRGLGPRRLEAHAAELLAILDEHRPVLERLETAAS